MRDFFIPSKKNKFTPHLLNRTSLLVYLVTLFAFNFILSSLGLLTIDASIGLNDVFEQHNEQRYKNGIGTLRINQALNVSATKKAQAMIDSNCWAHYCPEGVSPWKFFDDAGYFYTFAGENLAEGFTDSEDIMTAWMNSPTHRENVLNPNFTEMGIGFAYGSFQGNPNNTVVVIHFGSKAADTSVFAAADVAEITQPEREYASSIISPKDGTIQSTPLVQIEGITLPPNNTIELTLNEEPSGRVIAEGENFTFRKELPDGNYKIGASVINEDTGTYLANSDYVNISIDTIIPVIYRDTFYAGKNTDSIRIEFQSSLDTISVSSNIESIEFNQIEQGYWFGVIEQNQLESREFLEIYLTDSADNLAVETFDSTTILFEAEANSLEENELNAASILGDRILTPFLDDFRKADAKELFSLLFIGYLAILFMVDIFVLVKTEMIHKVERKSHIHMALLLVTFVFLHIGGVGGNILVGLAS